MIVWLASYPRSGNSLLANLIQHHFGLPLYSIYKKLHDHGDVYIHLNQAELLAAAHSQDLFLIKTHEMPLDDATAIYLVRDGRDAIVSYAHYIIDHPLHLPIPAPEDLFDWALNALINSSNQFGGWGNHVHAWTNRPSARTALVRYEDLTDGTRQLDTLKSALQQLNLDHLNVVNDAPLPKFSKYNKLMPNFYRKGQVGSWAAELPSAYHLKFWEQYGDSMQKLGYKRNEEQNTIRTEFVLSEFSQAMDNKIEQMAAMATSLDAAHQSNRQISLELLDAQEQIKQTREQLNILEEQKNVQLAEKEEVIQNFRQSLMYSLIHGPFRSISILLKTLQGWKRRN